MQVQLLNHTNAIQITAANFVFDDSWDIFLCYQAHDCSAHIEGMICLTLEAVHATAWCCHTSGFFLAQVRLKAIQCISAMLISSASKSAPSGPVSALKDPSKAPLIAYLFSILMKAAEGEMKAGLTGSKTLSAAALKAVRCLTQAVNDGDALAFVLPGLASGLAKIMISAGDSITVYVLGDFAPHGTIQHVADACWVSWQCPHADALHAQSLFNSIALLKGRPALVAWS